MRGARACVRGARLPGSVLQRPGRGLAQDIILYKLALCRRIVILVALLRRALGVDGRSDGHLIACMSFEEEDTCMSYEEEDTCDGHLIAQARGS